MAMGEGDREALGMRGPRVQTSEVVPTLAELETSIPASEKIQSNGKENGGGVPLKPRSENSQAGVTSGASNSNGGSLSNGNSTNNGNGTSNGNTVINSSSTTNGNFQTSNNNGNVLKKKSKGRGRGAYHRSFASHEDTRQQQQQQHSQQHSRGYNGSRQQQANHGMEYRVKEPKKATSKDADTNEKSRPDINNRRQVENGRSHHSTPQAEVETGEEKNQRKNENGPESSRNERIQALRSSHGPAGALSARVFQQVLPHQQARKIHDTKNGAARKHADTDLPESRINIVQVVKETVAEGRDTISAESRQAKKPVAHDPNSDICNQWIMRFPHGATHGPFSSAQLLSWQGRYYGPDIEVRRQNNTSWATLGSIIGELREGIGKDTGCNDNGHYSVTNQDHSHASSSSIVAPTAGVTSRPQRKSKRNIGNIKHDKSVDKVKNLPNGNRQDNTECENRYSARVAENHLSTQQSSHSQADPSTQSTSSSAPQSKKVSIEAATALFASSDEWRYVDDEGTERGPFDGGKMMQWYNNDFLPQTLLVRRGKDISGTAIAAARRTVRITLSRALLFAYPNHHSRPMPAPSVAQLPSLPPCSSCIRRAQGSRRHSVARANSCRRGPVLRKRKEHAIARASSKSDDDPGLDPNDPATWYGDRSVKDGGNIGGAGETVTRLSESELQDLLSGKSQVLANLNSINQAKDDDAEPETAKEAQDWGLELFRKGQYEEAKALFEKSLTLPGSGVLMYRGQPRELSEGEQIAAYYNIACAKAKMVSNPPQEDEIQEILISLQAAVKAGFDDVKKLEADPDFAALTFNPIFKQFIDDLRPRNLFEMITRMF